MLVLSRKVTESIRIGDNITVKVVRLSGNCVKIAIEAPKEIKVLRGELIGKDTDETPRTMV